MSDHEKTYGPARTFGQDLMRGEGGYAKPTTVAKGLAFGEMPNYDGADRSVSGTSIFDPVMCELSYAWFSPPGGIILDPFSGGSVRGIVAAMLGRKYIGIDLSGRQIAANRIQAARICADDNQPLWIEGTSVEIETLAAGVQADMVFTCPPYADLEVYSDDPDDLSNMPYEQFHEMYRQIIAACVRMMHNDRFAGIVVGDIRDKKTGFYRNFTGHTVQAFIDAGAGLYNEAVLVTSVGSLPIRAGKQFAASRKLGKTHQNLYIFCKGDPKRAADACQYDPAFFDMTV